MEKVEKGEDESLSTMSSSMKNWLFFVILIVVALLVSLWEVYVFTPFHFSFGPRPPFQVNPADLQFYYAAQTVVSTINIALLVFLLVTYVNIYRKTRSEFTIGLLIFSAALLFKDVAANPAVIGQFGFRAYGLGPFALLPDVFEFVALSVLLYLSVKY